MADIFQLLRVVPLVAGGTSIQWRTHPSMPLSMPVTFTCQVSREGADGTAGWTDLPNVLVGDASKVVFSNVDKTQRTFTIADRVYYRVKLVDNDGKTYYSRPLFPYADLPRQDRLHVQYIIRDQFLRMRSGAGVCGFLFKRKYWGTRCTQAACLDKDTREQMGRRCSTCLGTGWVGGYAQPIPFWTDFTDNLTKKISTVTTGQTFAEVNQVQVILCPEIQTGDIFLDPASDVRYWIDSIDVTLQVRHIPVLARVMIREIEPTSVVTLLDQDHAG